MISGRPMRFVVGKVAVRNVFLRVLRFSSVNIISTVLNPLTPNDLYKRRTAQLTSRRCSLYIYSTNMRTEYFKRAA